MKNKKLLVCAVVVAVVLLLMYTVHFFGVSLSDDSSDWGAFGSFMGIGLSAVSIALIYITYDEQRSSNNIFRFEQRYSIIIKTLERLAENNKEEVDFTYQKYYKHFLLNSGISGYERSGTAKVLSYYYSLAMYDIKEEFTHIFRYLDMCIAFIHSARSLADDEKDNRIIELSCIVPESIRMFYLCWLLSHNSSALKRDYESGLFVIDDSGPELLRDVVKFVCTGKQSIQSEFENNNDYEIDLKDYSEELFCDTYNRLNKLKGE